jgi:hypothetical protein
VTLSDEWPIELKEITRRLGDDALTDVRVWHLYGGWFGFDFLWQAKASPAAVECLRNVALMKPIHRDRVPNQFWRMPSAWSEIPGWWKPKPDGQAQYLMSPTFVPRNVHSDRLDCIAMYDPDQQMLYVWSQWDF